MPAQPRTFSIPPSRPPAVPGAINILTAGLSDDVLIAVYVQGPLAALTTLGQLRAFFGSPLVEPLVVIESGSTYQMEDTDGGMVNRKTVPGALAVTLPETPPLWGVVRVSDFTGDIASYPLSVTPSGTGTINGASGTFTYSAAYETTGFQAISIDETTGAVEWLMRP